MQKQKAWRSLILVLFLILSLTSFVFGEEAPPQRLTSEQVISKQLNALDLSGVEKSINQVEQEFGQYIPSLRFRDIFFSQTNKGFKFDFLQLFNGVLRYFFQEVVTNFHLLGKLLVVAVIYSLLRNLQNSFGGASVSKVAYGVCYLAVMGLAIGSFQVALSTGKGAIEQMVTFMQALIPVLMTILAAMGGLVSVTIFQPLTIMVISLISTLMGNLVLPLISISAILTLIGHISEDFPLSRLSSLFKEASVGLIGLFLSIFVGAVLVQGAISSIADGVSLQTAKFATNTFIPVVGGVFSDALEMVLGCSLLIRNALGGVGILVILIICLFPAIKIISIILTYRLAAALIQPIGDGNLVECLSSIGNSLILVFAVLAVVSLMFFIMITVLVGIGNVAVMMR